MTGTITSPRELSAMLKRAATLEVVVAGVLTSERCPWCVALKREQLQPRVRSTQTPALVVIEFDVDIGSAISFPDGKRITAAEWGQSHGMRLTPTLAMLDTAARPILAPLVGYASRDFYAAYLEDQIKSAMLYWQNRR